MSELSSCILVQADVSKSLLIIGAAKFQISHRRVTAVWFSMLKGCQYRQGQFALSIQSANHSIDDNVWLARRSIPSLNAGQMKKGGSAVSDRRLPVSPPRAQTKPKKGLRRS